MDITLNDIANIIDDNKGNGYFSTQMEKALKPMFDKFKSLNKDTSDLQVADLFKLDPLKAKRLADRYEKVANSLLDRVEGAGGLSVENASDDSVDDGSYSGAKHKEVGGGFKTELTKDKVIDVKLVGIIPDLFEGMFVRGKHGGEIMNGGREVSGGGGGGLMGKLSGMLGGGLALAALGALAIFYGIKNDNKYKGLLKIVGAGLFKMSRKMFESIGKRLGGLFPDGIGVFIKDHIKKIGKRVFAFFKSKVTKFMPKKIKVGKGLISRIFGKLMSAIGAVGKGGKKGASLVFRKIPGLGTIISFAFAFSRFNKGDYIGGMLDITAGLLVMVPAYGTALSFIPDAINMFRDFKMTSAQKASQSSNMMQGLKEWLSNLNLAKSFTLLFGGIGAIFSGDIDGGLISIKQSGSIGLMPWLGSMVDVIQYLREGDIAYDAGYIMGQYGYKFIEYIGDLVDDVWSTTKLQFDKLLDSDMWKKLGDDIYDGAKNIFETIKNMTLKMQNRARNLLEKSSKMVVAVSNIDMSPAGAIKRGKKLYDGMFDWAYDFGSRVGEGSVDGSQQAKQDELGARVKEIRDREWAKKAEKNRDINRKKKEKAEKRKLEMQQKAIELQQENNEIAMAALEEQQKTTQVVRATADANKGGAQNILNFLGADIESKSEKLRHRVFMNIYQLNA